MTLNLIIAIINIVFSCIIIARCIICGKANKRMALDYRLAVTQRILYSLTGWLIIISHIINMGINIIGYIEPFVPNVVLSVLRAFNGKHESILIISLCFLIIGSMFFRVFRKYRVISLWNIIVIFGLCILGCLKTNICISEIETLLVIMVLSQIVIYFVEHIIMKNREYYELGPEKA